MAKSRVAVGDKTEILRCAQNDGFPSLVTLSAAKSLVA